MSIYFPCSPYQRLVSLYLVMFIAYINSIEISDAPPPEKLATSAAVGIAFVLVFGCIYIATAIYLYVTADKHIDHNYNQIQADSLDGLASDYPGTYKDAGIPTPSGKLAEHFKFSQSSNPTEQSTVNSLYLREGEHLHHDQHKVHSPKSKSLSPSNHFHSAISFHNVPQNDEVVDPNHQTHANNSRDIELVVPIESTNVNIMPDESIDVTTQSQDIFNPIVAAASQEPGDEPVGDLTDPNNDVNFWSNYTGYNPFFTRCTKLQGIHLNAKVFSNSKDFNQSLGSMVKLFDGNLSDFNGWIVFSRINLVIQNRAQNIADIVLSCYQDAQRKLKKPASPSENAGPTSNSHENISLNGSIPSKDWGLSLKSCRLDSQSAFNLIQTISLHQFDGLNLTKLDLSANPIDETFMFQLGNLLKNPLCSLEEICLALIPVTDTGTEILSEGIRYNKRLRHLDLSYCGIERLGCYFLASALADIPIDPKVATILEQRATSTPQKPHNNRPPVAEGPNNGGASRPQSIKRTPSSNVYNSSLSRLNLSGNKIAYGGGVDLSNVLKRNSSIKYLDISFQKGSKKIGPDGAREIATALRVDGTSSVCQLQTLRCARNSIGFEGCRHIASALLSNKTLTELDIGDVNYITIAGAMQLAQAIMYTTSSRISWLTIGDYRLPISVLLGDRQIHLAAKKLQAQLAREARKKRREAKKEHHDTQINKITSIQTGFEVIASTLIQGTQAIIKLDDLPIGTHPHINHEQEYQSKELVLNIAGDDPKDILPGSPRTRHNPISPYPISLHLVKIPRVNYLGTTVVTTTEHGMNDEMGVVIGTLLQNNSNLKYIKLNNTYLPVQKLTGTIPTSYMDLSEKNLTSIDTIIIGILAADNDWIRTLNLKGNNFAETEGENYIAYALERNQKLSLDLAVWPAEKMFTDGYRTLASRQGLSASGAIIEPQRLEGWFYQGLTIYSAIFFYINLAFDIIAVHSFASQPKVYHRSWTIISAFLICFSSVLYAYTTFRNLMFYDLKDAFIQAGIVLVQLTPMFQAYECVMASMESTAMLDFKYVMGVYKSIPQTFLKTYIMFYVGINSDEFDLSVLTSIALSIISITVIFIMRYDRKDSRRFAMVTVSEQPLCAIYIAAFLSFCGMGKDTVHVEGFVNFDSYYTSHYVWAYVYQLVCIYSRVVSLSWLLATVPSSSQILVPFIILWSRYILLVIVDYRFFKHTLYHNFVKSLSLGISDSAWAKDEKHPHFSRMCCVCLGIMTTCEDIICAIYVTFVAPYLQYPVILRKQWFFGIFASLIVAWSIRWALTFHWLLPIHFPELYIGGNLPHEDPEVVISALHTPKASNNAINHLSDNSNVAGHTASSPRHSDLDNLQHVASAISEQLVKARENIQAKFGWKPKTHARVKK